MAKRDSDWREPRFTNKIGVSLTDKQLALWDSVAEEYSLSRG